MPELETETPVPDDPEAPAPAVEAEAPPDGEARVPSPLSEEVEPAAPDAVSPPEESASTDEPEGTEEVEPVAPEAVSAEEFLAPEPPPEESVSGDGGTVPAVAEEVEPAVEETEPAAPETVSAEEFLVPEPASEESVSAEDARLRAVLEAIVYITDEPLTLAQIAAALSEPQERVQRLLDDLVTEFDRPGHGLTIREVAGGYKMATKPEHHDDVRNFVKSLKPPLKLSLAALETLAVIAYKQPVTAPEIMEIRGVQGAGVLKTLLDRKLIAVAGRKNVIGKPILYKTTKEFLIQFGLKDLAELPTLKEFEEIGRLALSESEPAPAAESETAAPAVEAPVEAVPESDEGNG